MVTRQTSRRAANPAPAAQAGLPPGAVVVQHASKPPRRRAVSILLKLALFVAVMFIFGLPALAKGREGLRRLADVNPALLALGLLLEFSAVASYSYLTRAALPADSTIAVMTLTRIHPIVEALQFDA